MGKLINKSMFIWFTGRYERSGLHCILVAIYGMGRLGVGSCFQLVSARFESNSAITGRGLMNIAIENINL